MKNIIFAVLMAVTMIGCASTPYPHDTSRSHAAGTMIGSIAGYTMVESMANTHPIMTILGTFGGAAVGRSIGASLNEE